ncbi:MAG: hypothetical protein HEQ25_10825 [Dolichospermum sp. DET73]|nr:hypothetical protein [Dolichospermum sp. DET73]
MNFPAKITKVISPATVFVPMHWGRLWVDDAEANTLTYSEAFHNSVQAGLKAYAVPLLPISVESTFKNYQFQSSQW